MLKKIVLLFLRDSYIIFFFLCHISILNLKHSFKTRSGLTGQLGLEPSQIEEKIKKGKIQCDPVKNPIVTFDFGVFLLK
jgi:hypothetical protein